MYLCPDRLPAATQDFLNRTVVVIPAWNEAPCVADTVRYWRARGAALVRVVDNGRNDATVARAWEAGAEVRHEPRGG
ncbi:MAG: hypothetical protein EXS37_16050 [Opitutus sp.]|nr:hypothetical protein [Opitutus sp.]